MSADDKVRDYLDRATKLFHLEELRYLNDVGNERNVTTWLDYCAYPEALEAKIPQQANIIQIARMLMEIEQYDKAYGRAYDQGGGKE